MGQSMRSLGSMLMTFVAVAHVVLLMAMAMAFPGPNDSVASVAMAMGVITGHASLMGVWFLFGPGETKTRAIAAFGVLFASTAAFSCFVIRTNGGGDVVGIGTVAVMIQWATAVLPLWMMCRFGWRCSKDIRDVEANSKTQFHLRHLFVWVTGTAILFAVGRLAIPKLIDWMSNDILNFALFFAIVVIGNALVAGPVTWAILSHHRTVEWTGAAIFAVISASYAQYICLSSTMFGQRIDVSAFAVIMSASFVVTLFSAMIFARTMGYRLHNSAAT